MLRFRQIRGHGPAHIAQPLNYTWAITLALLAVPLLKQPLTRRMLAGILVSVGVSIVDKRGMKQMFQDLKLLKNAYLEKTKEKINEVSNVIICKFSH